MSLPKGYGLRLQGERSLAAQPHDPQPDAGGDEGLHGAPDRLHPEERRAAARGIQPVRPIWMDVQNGQLYPVFNVRKGSGEKGSYTYPNDEPAAYGGRQQAQRVGRPTATACSSRRRATCIPADCTPTSGCAARARRVAQAGVRQQALVQGAPALQGAGAARLRQQRPPVPLRREVLRAGGRGVLGRGHDAAPARDWRVKIHKGDTLWTSATYDTKRGSWWESMGIMVAYMADGGSGAGPVQEAGRLSRQADPRPPAREPQPRRRARRACPTRASCPTARRWAAARSTSWTSSTPWATSASPGSNRQPAGHPARPGGHVPQPRERQAPVPLDHLVQGAL